MLGLVLLYVGAVLFVNGIWLLGRITPREVAIMNVFTGLVGLVVAIFAVAAQDLASIQLAGYVLLFAFTYLWVAYNQYIDADGSGLGWYCLFVAITAVPVSIITLSDTGGDTFLVWLGLSWAVWAVLWFTYFLLLAVKRPIQQFAAYLTIAAGIGTAWLPGFLVLNDYI
ncbi:AmiS/UreI family transporter [Phytoactinopolyspora mesophila]|uniref:Transporter n=1 Tax=Phytoactinopolyspora mesophila TaxID=2650750 RepID=A0A7K3M8U1_9ACTN|nr:AmiS/UreI family transporter [Phytoactinopolyspora mesophila]NDL59693.1 transporter [Phytoactinopolyspora mesophila]